MLIHKATGLPIPVSLLAMAARWTLQHFKKPKAIPPEETWEEEA